MALRPKNKKGNTGPINGNGQGRRREKEEKTSGEDDSSGLSTALLLYPFSAKAAGPTARPGRNDDAESLKLPRPTGFQRGVYL